MGDYSFMGMKGIIQSLDDRIIIASLFHGNGRE